MGLQYLMYKVSQLGAAKPRGFVKPAASAAGETLSVPPAASPHLRTLRGAHAPQLASGKSIGLLFRQLSQPVVKNSRLRRFSPVTIYFEEV